MTDLWAVRRATLDAERSRQLRLPLGADEGWTGLWAQPAGRFGDPRGVWHRVIAVRLRDGTPSTRLSCCYRRIDGVFVLTPFRGVERDPPPLFRCRVCSRRKDPP